MGTSLYASRTLFAYTVSGMIRSKSRLAARRIIVGLAPFFVGRVIRDHGIHVSGVIPKKSLGFPRLLKASVFVKSG